MKQILKKLTKIFSLVLVVTFAFISFTACKNDNASTEAQPTGDSTQITDTTTTIPDAKPVTDTDKTDKNEPSEVEPSNPTNEISPITGLYVFEKTDLSYSDTYYYNRSELLTYFKTTDINGVFDIAKRLGFDEFAAGLTKTNINSTDYRVAFSIKHKENSTYTISILICDSYERYTTLSNSEIDFNIDENGIITTPANTLNLEYNAETDSLVAYFPFSYKDENANEIFTPLFVKANLISKSEFENYYNSSKYSEYTYKENSATVNATADFAYLSKLAEMLAVEESEVLTEISNCKLIFINNKSELFISAKNTIISTQKAQTTNSYMIYNSFNVDIINENIDITTGVKTLNLKIEIDATTTFYISFVANA